MPLFWKLKLEKYLVAGNKTLPFRPFLNLCGLLVTVIFKRAEGGKI